MFFLLFSRFHTHFSSGTYRLASGVGFSACFSLKKHTPCVFLLTSSPKNTRRVFFCLLLPPKTHFSLRLMPISFQFVFSCLFFSQQTHAMGFSACFFSKKHTFPFGSSRLVSGLCFLACFSLKKHTPCVFLLTSSPKNTLFPPVRID